MRARARFRAPLRRRRPAGALCRSRGLRGRALFFLGCAWELLCVFSAYLPEEKEGCFYTNSNPALSSIHPSIPPPLPRLLAALRFHQADELGELCRSVCIFKMGTLDEYPSFLCA